MMKYYVTIWIFTTVVLSLYKVSVSDSKSKKTVLVFGGSGTIGTEVVQHLLRHNYKLVLVNRGNWKYDTATLIKPYVTHIPCDRNGNDDDVDVDEDEGSSTTSDVNLLTLCPELMEFVETQNHIDFVIDFSAETHEAVEHSSEVLKGKVGLYIYISSDTVYEVCRNPKEIPIKETESVRPRDKKEREETSFGLGQDQLQIEEFLMHHRAAGGFPYMVLRLPDVVGPHDQSHRWWQTQIRIKYYHTIKEPIGIYQHQKDLKTSLVYIKDIAQAILSAMEAGDIVYNQVYNIGFDESFHYKDIVKSIAKELNITGIQFKEVEKDAYQFYPSFTLGPLDTSKIKQHLGFMPTPWEQAVNNTVAWYERALHVYDNQVQEIIDMFLEHIVPEENKGAFFEAIWKREEL